MTIQAFKQRFDPILFPLAEARVKQYNQRCSDVFVRHSNEHMLTLIKSGGKRIRPYIACTIYEMLGGRITKPVMELFSALELFHVFALIHDDIIDHGMERHGVPTLHRFIHKSLETHARVGDLAHIASGQAMLLGDVLHAAANYLMMRGIKADANRLRRLRAEFDAMVEEVLLGEALDVDTATRRTASSELIEQKMYLKTASYTFIRPMKMGAALAGASKSFEGFCEVFGAALGLAFQIQDDLLDLTASTQMIHKTIFSDLQERQHTVFTQHIFEHGTKTEQTELQALMGIALTEAHRPRVEKLFQDSGAVIHGRARLSVHFDEAERALAELQLPMARKQTLRDLLKYIRDRSL